MENNLPSERQILDEIEDDHDHQAVPLMLVSAYQDQKLRNVQNQLPNLPSHNYRYSVWHDLPNASITGDRLKAPRIRQGPEVKDEMFYKLRDQNNKRVHHSLRGKERKNYQDKMENWENAKHANLSYQDLQQDYQKKNFIRVLKRLIRAQEIVLIDDRLQQLQSVSFPCVTHLNLTQNYIESFKHLPKMPFIESLILSMNIIKDLTGLERFRKTPLKYLMLKGNPVCYELNYRPRLFAELPTLLYLDDIPRNEADDKYYPEFNGTDQSEAEAQKSSYCVIM